jgi:hypothetical protein
MAGNLHSHPNGISKLEEVLPYARTHSVSQSKRQGYLSSKSVVYRAALLVVLALLVTVSFLHKEPPLPDLYEAGILELRKGLELHQFTSVDLVKVE